MAVGQGAQPYWAPVQGPSTATGSPLGVTYLTKARQVTQMSSAAPYTPFALGSGTICSFVSTLPSFTQCREMLYRLCSLQTSLLKSFHHQSDVVLHQGTTFKELLLSSEIGNALEKSLNKGLPVQMNYYCNWPHDVSTRVWGWVGIHLTKGQPALSSTKIGHKMSLPGGGVHLTKLVPNLATRCFYQGWGGGMGQGAGAGTGEGVGVHLTKDQQVQSSTKLGHERSLPGGTSDQRLTKCQADLK